MINMPNRITQKDQKNRFNVDILNNDFYTKLLIMVALGNDTYKKLMEFRKAETGKKIAYANLNVQIGRLIDNKYLFEVGLREKYNKKRFVVNWDLLASHYFDYIISILENDQRTYFEVFNEYSGIMAIYLKQRNPESSLKGIFKEINDCNKKDLNIKESKEIIKKSQKMRLQIIKVTKELKDHYMPFLRDALDYYFVVCNPLILFNNTFDYHFSKLTDILVLENTQYSIESIYTPKLKDEQKIIWGLLDILKEIKNPPLYAFNQFYQKYFHIQPITKP